MTLRLSPVRGLALALLAALPALAPAATYEFKHAVPKLSVSVAGSPLPPEAPVEPGPAPETSMLSASTSSLVFADTLVGQTSAEQQVLLANTGNVTLTLGTPSVTGPFTLTHNCPATLAPDASCVLAVRFVPTQADTLTGLASVSFSGSSSPVQVGLTGLGYLATDPYWSSVNLLMNFDALPYTTNKTAAVLASAITQSTDLPGGAAFGYSGAFAGNTEAVKVANNGEFSFGLEDFTVEARIKPSAGATRSIVGTYQWKGGYFGGWRLRLDSANKLYFGTGFGATGTELLVLQTPTALTTGVWYHVAVIRAGSTFKLFVNGSVVASAANANTLRLPTAYASVLRIGSDVTDGGVTTNRYVGLMDDVRITRGLARYTAPFTVSSEPHSPR